MKVLLNQHNSKEKQFKFVIVGEQACGKSSIVLRYCHDEFSRQYYPTVGVDIFLKRTLLDIHSVRLIIWDVSGNSLSSSLLDKYLYEADVVLLIFDITNSNSFTTLATWYYTILNIINNSKFRKPLIFVIANKCDMEHQRAVSTEKQNKFLTENHLVAYNVSSRTGENVTMCLQKIIAKLLGLKLSKNELEIYQKTVKAEVFINQAHQVRTSYQVPSSICQIQ